MSDPFPPNSRYAATPLRTRTRDDGTTETFVGRRIIPGTERYRALDRYRSDGNTRIDMVAAASFADPLLYWRICDANGVADPAEATEPAGRLLVIPMPLEITTDADA